MTRKKSYKKGELKDFIEEKIQKKIRAVEKERKEIITPLVDDYMKHIGEELRIIEDDAMELGDKISRTLTGPRGMNDYSLSQTFSAVRFKLTSIYSMVEDKVRLKITEVAKETREEYSEKEYDSTMVFLGKSVREEYKESKQKERELKNLKTELFRVINMNASGKQAYEALIKLDVDMSEFDKELQLPSVIKLNSDVNLLNE
jgi:hypothetical protein